MIGETLRVIGIGPHYQGYRQLAIAIELALQSGADRVWMTKELYPAIAERCNTSCWCVEKNIRTAISRAWETKGRVRFRLLTGYSAEEKPTNGQFISLVAEALRDIGRESRMGELWMQFL